MKIFNWVQRKLHQNVIKDGLAKNVKKTESIAIDNNTLALLEQVALADILESWKDGILTIGTLGFDPLKSSDEHRENFLCDEEKEDEVNNVRIEENKDENAEDHDEDDDATVESKDCFQDDEGVNPLMFTKFEHNLEYIESGFDHESNIANVDVITTVDFADEATAIIGMKEIGEGKKKRTTLAELFLADTDISFMKPNTFDIEVNYGKKQFHPMKNNVSFAKKIIPMVKDHNESHPFKWKLRHMMKRMLKRKIHPGLDGDQSDGQNKPIKTYEDAESVSLLHVPDIMV